MPSKIITSVHNSLPKNKKSSEFNELFRSFIYTTFTEEEFSKFCEDMEALTEFANMKYPKTKPYFFRVHPKSYDGSHSVSVVIEGKDDCISAHFCPIGKAYSEI